MIQKQLLRGVPEKNILKIFGKLTGKLQCQNLVFDKVVELHSANLLTKNTSVHAFLEQLFCRLPLGKLLNM